MSTPLNTVTVLVAVFLVSVVSQSVFAQAVVRDSTPAASSDQQVTVNPPAPVAPVRSEPRFDPSSQVQLLQDEIMSLRGLIEEQAFEIRRLKQQRLDDYLDLDKRITAVETRKPEPAAPSVTSALPPVLPAVDENAEEKKLYNDAIDQLLDRQDYAAAKQGFEAYSNSYPNGLFAANSQYWLGQIFLTEGDNESAEKAFVRIVDSYPDHQKAPDAQFKLAKIYFDRGEKEKSKSLLDKLATSDSEAARFAQSFLEENF